MKFCMFRLMVTMNQFVYNDFTNMDRDPLEFKFYVLPEDLYGRFWGIVGNLTLQGEAERKASFAG